MQPLPGPDPPPGDGWQGAGVSQELAAAGGGQGFGSPASPHPRPRPGEGGGRHLCWPGRGARDQTWPPPARRRGRRGRYVPPHAYGSAFPAGGLRHITGAWLGLPGRTGGVGGADDVPDVSQLWESRGWVGRGGRSRCSGAVAVLVTRSRQAVARHAPGNRCSWIHTPRDTALGAAAWGLCAHARGHARTLRVGDRVLGSGQEGDGAGRHMGCPAWHHPVRAVARQPRGLGLSLWEQIPREDALCPEQRGP